MEQADADERTEPVIGFLLRLAGQAEWLAAMIQWELAADRKAGKLLKSSFPLSGGPQSTKTQPPPPARVPGGLPLAA
jgi:hypothetical protein